MVLLPMALDLALALTLTPTLSLTLTLIQDLGADTTQSKCLSVRVQVRSLRAKPWAEAM